ncbi:MAG: DUF1501 domain-containing protein [Planctomycetaceae bacterium]|nr:DUF1501 domain-containing protein [Planctomycetaceae bacterium]
MLTLLASQQHRDCNGASRRDFLKIGTLGLGGITLPQLLAARSEAAEQGRSVKDTAVVWLWLSGGPTHIETFDPKMTAPSEYRSTSGEVATTVPGVTLGGHFPKLAQNFHKLAIVRSFAHTNSGHGGGTHYVMTGYDNRQVDNGGVPTRPAMGAALSKIRGANHPQTGMPTYIRMNSIGSDGAAFLGPAYSPFDPNGQARQNMALATKVNRIDDRRELLGSLDRFRRDADQSGLMDGLDAFESQAFNLLLGNAPQAFDMAKEDEATRNKYGKDQLAQQMLVARRLVEAGCGFVTINYGGWDMHGTILRSMAQRAPAVDHAVSTFLDDLWYRGLDQKVLLIISGEFGRTPRINGSAGRDHWAPLSTLALAGGGFRMGQVIGESMPKADLPKTTPIKPLDLMATVFHHLGVDPQTQFTNPAGRPVYLLEGGTPIAELL